MSGRRALALAFALSLATGLPACGTSGQAASEKTEEEPMAIYIVAIKRERRSDAPEDWVETLRATPGVEVPAAGDASPERRVVRVRVRATASGVVALRERVGAFCHVEPLIEHRGGTAAEAASPSEPSSESPSALSPPPPSSSASSPAPSSERSSTPSSTPPANDADSR